MLIILERKITMNIRHEFMQLGKLYFFAVPTLPLTTLTGQWGVQTGLARGRQLQWLTLTRKYLGYINYGPLFYGSDNPAISFTAYVSFEFI